LRHWLSCNHSVNQGSGSSGNGKKLEQVVHESIQLDLDNNEIIKSGYVGEKHTHIPFDSLVSGSVDRDNKLCVTVDMFGFFCWVGT
jgi:hypothetical protein